MDDLSLSKATLSNSDLVAKITELAGHLNAGEHRWLVLIAEFDRRQGWSDGYSQSCAHWLNWKCGLDMGAAREKVRVARALETLPKISATMARGEVSYSKVRAMTRIATEANEDYLLSIALYGTAHHVEKLVRSYRRMEEAAELSREAQQQARRELRFSYDEDGSLIIKGRLPAEAGALFMKAVDAIAGGIFNEPQPAISAADVSAETQDHQPTLAVRRADALAQVAESFLKHGLESLSGGERHQIVIHIDEDTLRADSAGRCEMEHGPSMAAETARRLACDASVVALVENGNGEPLNIGRKTRTIPPALRRALNARDKGCRFPGCINTQYVDAHHIHHWAKGGETKSSNLVTLCRFHHRKVHEGGISIQVLDDGAFRFIRPDGVSVESIAPGYAPVLTDWTELTERHHRAGLHINPNTAITRWDGERMDYSIAVGALIMKAQKARALSGEGRVSAETPSCHACSEG